MANYLYNGVELPELPEWDKTIYPYAAIVETVTGSSIMFYATASQLVKDSDVPYDHFLCYGIEGTACISYEYKDGAWTDLIEYVFGAAENPTTDYRYNTTIAIVVWTDYNLLREDGSVYLPASDPVPVETEDETTTPINSNTYIVKGGKVYKVGKLYQARVGADPILQEKTVTENGEVTADEGYEGLSKVTVNVATYITVATVDDLPTDAEDGTIAIVGGA